MIRNFFRLRAFTRNAQQAFIAGLARREMFILSHKMNMKAPQPQKSISIANNKNFSSDESFDYKNTYEVVANETLESLTERFDYLSEELGDKLPSDYDVTYSNGVLNVVLGSQFGTYVLNKQTPNLQIWLSSPISGPKRFDFIDNRWIYKRTGESLHELLASELSTYFKTNIDLNKCAYASLKR